MRSSRVLAVVAVLAMVFGLSAVGALAAPPSEPPGHAYGHHHGGSPTPSPTVAPAPSPVVTATPLPAPGAEAPAPTVSPEGPSDSPEPSTTPDDPRGSGIVKLDREPWDNLPNNEPHVGCTFELDFYNYGEGITATYVFELWPPTGRQELEKGSVDVGEDPSGGGTDFDGSARVDLGPALLASGAEPHQHNGWHVKVTVNAPGSSGSEQKQKVFWVRECAAPTTSPTTPPPTVHPTTVRPTPPGSIAFTGSEPMPLAVLMLVLLVLGTVALRLSARVDASR